MKTFHPGNWRAPAFLLVLMAGSLLLSIDTRGCRDCPAPASESSAEATALLPDLPPETVIASVDGHTITLEELRRHREGKLTSLPPGTRIHDAALLELMIRRHWLAESARARGIEESDAFREMLARFRETAEVQWMTEADLEQRALAEIFLEQEVIAKMDIQPEDIEDMYAIFGPTLPEDTTLEAARPLFERHLKRQAAERYLRHELDQRQIIFHDAWLEHVRQQAK